MANNITVLEKEMTPRMEEVKSMNELDVGGKTTINDDVIASIASMTAKEVQGVADIGKKTIRSAFGGKKTQGVQVESGAREAILDMDMKVMYGFCIPEVVIGVRQAVAQRVLEHLGLVTKEININVMGIEFPDKMPGRVE
ncbi:MAG: Asp23/Gls24 family envelope stress response protein [SAR202 cluster bacterium]|nr:Asp23/Gls24 family envelope stress response protein [SAR202 cluster bacterium]